MGVLTKLRRILRPKPKPAPVIHLAHGEPRLHLWCDRCLTSARYEVDLYRLAANGPRQMGTIRRCHRCDVTTMPNDTIAYTDDDDA